MPPAQPKKFFYALPPLLLAIDLGIKQLILNFFQSEPYPISQSKEVLGSFFRLTYVQNRGITFGFFRDLPKPWSVVVLTATSLIALGVLGYFYKNISRFLVEKAHASARFALLTIFGGALGNITDRLIRGFVVDYLDFGIGTLRWYTFNFADICVVSGCIAMAVLMVFFEKKEPSAR